MCNRYHENHQKAGKTQEGNQRTALCSDSSLEGSLLLLPQLGLLEAAEEEVKEEEEEEVEETPRSPEVGAVEDTASVVVSSLLRYPIARWRGEL